MWLGCPNRAIGVQLCVRLVEQLKIERRWMVLETHGDLPPERQESLTVLARYADSDGYEKDKPRPHAWRWREWVINALNDNMPFDQFTIEQLAGDLLPIRLTNVGGKVVERLLL